MAKQDESYLDELLNSVITSGPTSVTSVTREEIRLRAEKKRLEKAKKQKEEEKPEPEVTLVSDVAAETVPEEVLPEVISAETEYTQESAFEAEPEIQPFMSADIEETTAGFMPDVPAETFDMEQEALTEELSEVLPEELIERTTPKSNTAKEKKKKTAKKESKKDSFKDAVKKLKKTVSKEPKKAGEKATKRKTKKEAEVVEKEEKLLEMEKETSDITSADFTDSSENFFPNEEFIMEQPGDDNVPNYFDNDKQDTDVPKGYSIFDDDDSFLDKMLEEDSREADTDSFFESALDEDLLKSLEKNEQDFLPEQEETDVTNMLFTDDTMPEESEQEDIFSIDNQQEEMSEPVSEPLFAEAAQDGAEELKELDPAVQDMLGNLFSDTEPEGGEAENGAEDEDYMQLLNSISANESEAESSDAGDGDNIAEDDILAMNDFMGDMDSSGESNLDSEMFLDDDLMNLIPDVNENQGKESSEKKGKQKKSAGGIFKKLFANIPSDLTEEQLAKMKEQAVADYDAKEEQAKADKVQKAEQAKSKEELKKQKEEEAAAKKAEQAKAKEEKKKKAAEAKAARKDEKLKRQQEIQNLIDEVDESNVGKINKTGAGIVFLMFISMAVFVIIGTNVYTYKRSMEDAANYFGRKFYNEAFYEVYGLEPKDEDIELYDKIITVMFVKKQLNSYENYYMLEMYPQALNSLLKGIKLYDKYYTLASTLEINSDFEYVKASILDELKQVFDISEEEAERIIAIEDRVVYSDEVYQYANKLQQQLVKDGTTEKSK